MWGVNLSTWACGGGGTSHGTNQDVPGGAVVESYGATEEAHGPVSHGGRCHRESRRNVGVDHNVHARTGDLNVHRKRKKRVCFETVRGRKG